MSTINYDLKKIKALVFDVDGVLSANVISMNSEGEPMRTVNIKDGYAIHQAAKLGVKLAIITSSIKLDDYYDFCHRHGLNDEEILYVGDDIPDVQIMRVCGLPCCPKDASPEVKALAKYISHAEGGYGCGRDIIEQYLKANGLWMVDERAFQW